MLIQRYLSQSIERENSILKMTKASRETQNMKRKRAISGLSMLLLLSSLISSLAFTSSPLRRNHRRIHSLFIPEPVTQNKINSHLFIVPRETNSRLVLHISSSPYSSSSSQSSTFPNRDIYAVIRESAVIVDWDPVPSNEEIREFKNEDRSEEIQRVRGVLASLRGTKEEKESLRSAHPDEYLV